MRGVTDTPEPIEDAISYIALPMAHLLVKCEQE